MKIFNSIIVLLICLASIAQETKKIESLDSFFAGIPLQKNYEKWIEHINNHPYLGIDSSRKGVIYSGFKPGIKSHFPFPDSVKVRLWLYSAINIDNLKRYSNDTIRTVSIEGIFGKSKIAKKQTDKTFIDLKLLLNNYYRKRNDGPFGESSGFVEGINENFPDVMIFRGYKKEQNSNYILLLCEFRQRISVKIRN